MGKQATNIIKGAVIGAAIATGIGAAMVASGGFVWAGSFLGMEGALAFFTQSLVINSVLGFASSALTPKPEDLTSAADLRGQTIMQRNTLTTRKLVYGEVKVSGAVVFMETTDANKNLHYCVTMAGHAISAVKSVFFNDKLIKSDLADAVQHESDTTSDPNYAGKAWVTAHFGAEDQSADSKLVAETSMTSQHQLRGIAYIYTKCAYDQDVYANGVPNISAIIQGRAVYDPRTGQTVYSNNAALCVLDYLRDDRYGLRATDDEVDFDAFSVAANICDELVATASGTEKRYTLNGVIDTGKQPAAIMKDMLSAMAGIIYYSNGKWKVRAGAYVSPTDSLSMDDIIGQIKVTTRVSNQANFNAVKGVFMSPEDNWQPVDYPSVTSTVFTAEDNGEQRFVDITLPFTTSSATAQRLAKISLYRNREQLTITVPCNLKAFKYEVGDTLYFSYERYGWTSKVFEVIGWELSQTGEGVFGVNLMLKETSAAVYAWSGTDESQMTRNNTTLPSFTDLPQQPVMTVSDELRSFNEEVITTLIVNLASTDPFVDRFEVEARKLGLTEYTNLGQASGNRFELLQVQDSTVYEVRARSVSAVGVRSGWATNSYQVVGKTAQPSDVTGLTGNLIGNQYLLTWNAVPDLDLSYYRVRFASSAGDMSYSNSISLIPKVARPSTSVIVPARNGTYYVKAVDKLGLASQTATGIVLDSNIESINNLNLIETLTEHPGFSGVFDSTVAVNDDGWRLVLDTDLAFDNAIGLFDDYPGLFDGADGAVSSEGYYYFANSTDLGSVYVSRLTAIIEHVRLDYVSLFDSSLGLFDDRQGLFDGDANAFDDTDAILQVRTTSVDPVNPAGWSGWSSFAVGDYKARAFEFRIKLTTQDSSATPAVTKLSVTIDMPDRVVSASDVLAPSEGLTVTYANGAFAATPSIGIGAQDLQTGDYYTITSKSPAGFTIQFKNSSDQPVQRTFDYVARGYGLVIS